MTQRRWSSDFPDTLHARSAEKISPRERRARLRSAEIYLPPAPYDPHAGSARVLLVYPNTYHVAMSNLGFLYLYRLLNEHPNIACERAFFEEGLADRSFETGSDAGAFDAILFTLPFEMDALNIVQYLRATGIPPMAADRRGRAWPFVGIGGAAPSLNPKFVLPMADAVFAGDIEPVFSDIADRLSEIRAVARAEWLESLESIHGVVTLRNVSAGRTILRPENRSPRGCFNTVATPHTEFSRSLLVEIERGCPFKCRFCTVGYERKKLVEMPVSQVADLIHQAESLGLKVGMIGSALLSSKLWKTERQIWEESSVDFTFASLRADKLHASNIAALSKHQRSLTLAPEVGSTRMMRLINKRMDLAAARERLAAAKAGGIDQVKLYFIYGFPFEREEDVQAIVDFCADAVRTGLRVRVSLNPFIPKPMTPLQWFPMQPLKTLKSKFTFLRDRLRVLGVKDVSGYSPREAVRQARLIFMDECDGPGLLAMASDESSLPDSSGRVDIFSPKSEDFVFPWDILETSVPKSELWSEARQIFSEIG